MSESNESQSQQQTQIEKPQLGKLLSALAKAQLEIFNPVKNKSVDVQGKEGKKGFGYEYAELCAVLDIIRTPLAKNGLSFTQTVDGSDRGWIVVTRLMHESDQHLRFSYPLYPKQNMSVEQGFAAGFTYAKRQALKGIFGIADDTEDKDGHDLKTVDGVTISDKTKASSTVEPEKFDPPESPGTVKPPKSNAPAVSVSKSKPLSVGKPLDIVGNLDATYPKYEPIRTEEEDTLLDKLKRIVKEKNIPDGDVKDYIRRVAGSKATSITLNSAQLENVITWAQLR